MEIFKNMKKQLITLFMLAFVSVGVSAAAFVRTPGGIKATIDSIDVEVEYYTPSAVRILKHDRNSRQDDGSYSVIAKPAAVEFTVKESGKIVRLQSSRLRVDVNTSTGDVAFYAPGSGCLLKEAGMAVSGIDDCGDKAYKVRQSFVLEKDEPVYGLGNLENGKFSQRGVNRKLMPGNVEDGVPVFVSVKGYGVIWDNYSPVDFIDRDGVTAFESEVAQAIDYYFIYGGDMDGVIAGIRNLTGDVPMFPLWTYGFWQSRERYKSQDEIAGVVKKYREIGVPLDGIIQDWQYWGNNYLWNAMEFMSPDFANPQKMVDDIHGMNARMIISIWSSFGPQTKPYRELAEKGLLFNIETWPQSGISHIWPPRMDYPSGVRVYDAYSPEARDIYWKNLSRLHDFGIDGWWMDSTEPDHFNPTKEDFDTPTYLGSFRKVRNAYPLMTVGGVYDHQRAVDSTKRVFILTRSGYTGQQRYGCNVWTGDVTSSWQNLRNQIPAMLNFSLTGNPNVNSDLGGFFCSAYNNAGPESAVKNPLFRELFVRWMQMGVFTPMMRSHGADIKREIYYFGEKGDPVFDAVADAIRLRYSLLPYIYSTSWNVTAHGGSMMKALPMDFPGDKKVWNMADEYMFGDNLLIAPIVKACYTPELITTTDENTGWDRKELFDTNAADVDVDFMKPVTVQVYLPAGTAWWDFATGERHRGGKTVEKVSDIGTIPVYVKAGSIIPVGPDVQYATEKPWDDLEIRVYPGADGSFTLYEDEFDNYNYEKGAYSEIKFKWDDKSGQLTVGDRKGAYPGMIGDRIFRVKIAGSDKAATIRYSGKEVTQKF